MWGRAVYNRDVRFVTPETPRRVVVWPVAGSAIYARARCLGDFYMVLEGCVLALPYLPALYCFGSFFVLLAVSLPFGVSYSSTCCTVFCDGLCTPFRHFIIGVGVLVKVISLPTGINCILPYIVFLRRITVGSLVCAAGRACRCIKHSRIRPGLGVERRLLALFGVLARHGVKGMRLRLSRVSPGPGSGTLRVIGSATAYGTFFLLWFRLAALCRR